jgi:ornithine cyclodeaminase/thiomorpholine-carboxylate dehydrogenase
MAAAKGLFAATAPHPQSPPGLSQGAEVRMEVLFLSKSEVERLLDPNALLDALMQGFADLSAGLVACPTRGELTVPGQGFLLPMPAWQPGKLIAVKMVTVFDGNIARGLPSHLALICLFDPATGATRAIIDGEHITAFRTAGAAAVSVRLLARPDARRLVIVGAGVQGRAHLALVPLTRDFDEILIGSLELADAERLAATHPKARAVSDTGAAVRAADVVCLASHAHEPIIAADWLRPGTHVSSVGYAPPRGELDPAIAARHTLFVETRLAFAEPPAGCAELHGLDPQAASELGEIVLGRRPGRQSASEITVYKAMGIAMEDMVAAQLVYERALAEGAGRTLAL